MTALRIAGSDYADLHEHLFRPDGDEHAVVILAGVHKRQGETVLLARELHLLNEAEFPPGTFGYRQIAPSVLARLGNRAAEEDLALVSCHSHPGATTRVSLSADDLSGHRRVFPHLLDIVDGQPVAGLAFGSRAAVGEVWFPGGATSGLSRVHVVGHNLSRLTPTPTQKSAPHERFDRQARMFGAAGQQILRSMSVGVVGLGGGGSMLVEQLAHLGMGKIVGCDFDVVKTHNLSRIVGAIKSDADRVTTKVEVARRLVARIDPAVKFEAVEGDISEAQVAGRIANCDFIFLATDTATSRLVVTAISQSYLIPTVQIGAKVDLRSTGDIESVYVAVRPVIPRRGCLVCAGLIDPHALQQEAATAEERASQNYLGNPDVVDPSVITLNGIAASMATNTMLMMSVGLAGEEILSHRLFDARHGSWLALRDQRDPGCLWCGSGTRSRFAQGDAAHLPVRTSDRRIEGERPSLMMRCLNWVRPPSRGY